MSDDDSGDDYDPRTMPSAVHESTPATPRPSTDDIVAKTCIANFDYAGEQEDELR